MADGCIFKALTLLAFFYVYKAKFDNHLARVKFTDEIFNSCGLFCSGGSILNGSETVIAINRGERPRPYGPKGPKRARSAEMVVDKPTFNLFMKLMILSGDIQQNPGPHNRYPCGVCSKEVKNNGIQCDSCDKWYHAKCCSVSKNMFNILANSSCVWICCNCGLPNFSSSLFTETGPLMSTYNSFELLANVEESRNSSFVPEEPLCASSPKNRQSRNNAQKLGTLKVLSANFNSIECHKTEFWNLLDRTNPDIIIGVETKLDSSITNSEIFPSQYTANVFREDRNRHGGGVLVAFKNDYIGTKESSMKTDCEIVWAKMEVAGCRTLHVCSYYKPSEGDEHSVQQFEESLQKLRQNSNSFVIIGGI